MNPILNPHGDIFGSGMIWGGMGFRVQRALGGISLPILAVMDLAEAVLWWQRDCMWHGFCAGGFCGFFCGRFLAAAGFSNRACLGVALLANFGCGGPGRGHFKGEALSGGVVLAEADLAVMEVMGLRRQRVP